MVVEANGGWSEEASSLLRRLGDALARATGGNRGEVTRHMFGRLAFLLHLWWLTCLWMVTSEQKRVALTCSHTKVTVVKSCIQWGGSYVPPPN